MGNGTQMHHVLKNTHTGPTRQPVSPRTQGQHPMQDRFGLSPRGKAQQAVLDTIQDSPSQAAQRQQFSHLFGNSSAAIQRLAISNRSMKKCGFTLHKGIEWIWYNGSGLQPNHVSALLDGGNVDHIHAKTKFKGGKVNRLDWDEGADGEWAGPKTYLQQAEDKWDAWRPDAINAGELTLRLLKAKAATKAKD